MNRKPLPGPAIIATMMLAVAIIATISVTGPIPASYEIIKDFQTMIAAFVAVGAAALAYRAAMAKVALDREIHNREQAYLRIGLYRRLSSQLDRLIGEVESVLGFLKSALEAKPKSRDIE